MATSLIILQQPLDQSLQAAGNDSYFTVSSNTLTTLTGVTDYKYVADIYVNTNLVATQKSFTNKDDNYIGVFNLKNIPSSFVESYIDFSIDYFFDQLDGLFGEVPNGYAEIVIAFGEEYLLNGVFTQNKGLTNSNTVNYINASVDYLDTNKLNYYNVYQIYPSGHTDGYFLGSFNPIFDTTQNYTWPQLRQFQYFFLNEDNRYNLMADITTYDQNGIVLGKYETAASGGTFTSGNKGLKYLAVGYSQLDQLVPTAYSAITGSKPIITDNVATYNIKLKNTAPGSQLTPYANFTIKESCDRFKRWNVYWLTQYGNYSGWRFDKQSQEKATKTQSEYKKIYGALNSSGQYQVNSYDRNSQTYYTSIENTVTLTTDFLTDKQVLYLKEMFVSPSIFIEDLDGTYYQVVGATVTDTDYKLNKRVNQRIYSLTVNFKLSYNDFRQLG